MKFKFMAVLKKELREVFRDKKSISMMLIIPFMIPLLVIGMSALFDMETNKPIEDYNKIGFSYEINDKEKEIMADLKIEPYIDNVENLSKMYDDGKIDLYVTLDQNKYTINAKDDDNATFASSLVEEYFNQYKQELQKEYLENNNIEADKLLNVIQLDYNILESDNFFANYIVTYAFMFLIMAITVSATYPATDATAGEKERGTLETLLTFPIKTKDIIIGKYLSVVLSCIITGFLSLILAFISLEVANNMFEIYKEVDITLSLSSTLFISIVIIAYSLLIGGLAIAIASKAKTFKEAQSSLSPLTFISFFPSMIAYMIDIDNSILYSSIPFLNYTLVFDEIQSGNINILHILFMILSTLIVIYVVLKLIIKQYKSEKVLFSN